MVTQASDPAFLVMVFMLKYLVRTGLDCRFLVSLSSEGVFVGDVNHNADVTKSIYRTVHTMQNIIQLIQFTVFCS